MKVQEWKKIDYSVKKHKCEAQLWHLKHRCKFTASYIMGEKKLCKRHAQEEALEILLESYKEGAK